MLVDGGGCSGSVLQGSDCSGGGDGFCKGGICDCCRSAVVKCMLCRGGSYNVKVLVVAVMV